MTRDDMSWCPKNQALAVREVVGEGERELVLSLLAFPSRSMVAPAGTNPAEWSAKENMHIHQDDVTLSSAINKPLELRNSNPGA